MSHELGPEPLGEANIGRVPRKGVLGTQEKWIVGQDSSPFNRANPQLMLIYRHTKFGKLCATQNILHICGHNPTWRWLANNQVVVLIGPIDINLGLKARDLNSHMHMHTQTSRSIEHCFKTLNKVDFSRIGNLQWQIGARGSFFLHEVEL